jgi:hypothetical protein
MAKKSRWTLPAAFFLALFLVGCHSSNQPPEEGQSNDASGTSTQAAKSAKGERRPRAKTEPRVEHLSVPAGTVIKVRLTDGLDSGKVEQGSTFQATMAEPLIVNGVEVAPVGSTVTGTVTEVVSAGRLKRPAELALALTSIAPPGGEPTPISTEVWGTKGKSHKTRNVEMIGGGAGVGTLIGALTGGKKGALIGGAVGAGAGTGVAAATGKKEIVLPPETQLSFKLNAPATFTVRKRA